MAHPFQSLVSIAPANGPGVELLGHSAFVEDIRSDDERTSISIPGTDKRKTGEQSVVRDRVVAGLLTLPALRRSSLLGGRYSEQDALPVLNSHYFIGKSSQETAIFRINNDSTVTFLPPEQFKLEIQNIFVSVSIGGVVKWVPADKFWKESPKRNQKKLVFKPGGTTDLSEYNLWRGFGVEPRKGWQKQRRLLRHIREVICRRDKKKFKYLIRVLALMVQKPHKH